MDREEDTALIGAAPPAEIIAAAPEEVLPMESAAPALPAPVADEAESELQPQVEPGPGHEHEDNIGNRRDDWRPQEPQGKVDENGGQGGRRRRRRRRGRRGRGGSGGGDGGGGGEGAPRQGQGGQNFQPRPANAGYSANRPPNRYQAPQSRPEDSRRQGQEQSVGGYVEEFDTGDDDSPPFEENIQVEDRRDAEALPPPNKPTVNRPPLDESPMPPAPAEIESAGETGSAPAQGDGGEEGAPRRKRRRGGRGRGRGRGGAAAADVGKTDAPSPDESAADEAPADAPAADKAEATEAAAPKKPSRRRGGAARPRRKPPDKAQETIEKAPVQERVVRTGSADRHLASDEPVAPAPLSRPHSYRDLDAIPDDFD